MGPTHRLVGGSSAFIASTGVGLPIPVVAASVVLAAATSSLPDDLERGIKLGRRRVLKLAHRRVTHRPFVQALAAAALFYALVFFCGPEFTLPIGVGAASLLYACLVHSLLDGMTVDPDGVQYFWPLSRRGYHVLPRFMRVWVGNKSRSEKVFIAVWVTGVLIYAYARFHSYIAA